MTNREAAATINADAIDILVDLKGYTRTAVRKSSAIARRRSR